MRLLQNTSSIVAATTNYRRTFLSAWLISFVACIVIILLLPRKYAVKSSIQLATTFLQGQTQAIDSPDQIAKRAIELYLPIALIGLNSQSNDLKAESHGAAINLSSIASAGTEEIHFELQNRVINQVIAHQSRSAESVRNSLSIIIASARRAVENYDDQIKLINERRRSFVARALSESELVGKLRTTFQKVLTKANGTAQETMIDEAQIREVREHLLAEELFGRNIDIAISREEHDLADATRQREDKVHFLQQNEFQLSQIHDPEVILAPSKVPGAMAVGRMLLMLAALAGSFILALLIILTFDHLKHAK